MSKQTPLKAIRAKCLDCSEAPKEVKLCNIPDCPLFNYRMGKNPGRSRKGILPKGSIQLRKSCVETGKITKDEGLNG